jgi:hypothetical protein
MLTIGFAFLARDTTHTCSVSRPRHAIRSLHFPFANNTFPSTGGPRCKMLLVCTMASVWLIDLDHDRFIPMMTSRMIMALKKAASSRQTRMDLELPTSLPVSLQDTCPSHRVESIQLSNIKE